MTTRLREALVAAVFVAAEACGADFPSCYRAANLPVPVPQSRTVILLDLTAPGDPVAVGSLMRVVHQLGPQPGERISMVTFAGLAAGEVPHQVLDFVNEPAPTEAQAEVLSIRMAREVAGCVGRLTRSNNTALVKTLHSIIAPPDRASGEFSEIVWALRWVGEQYGASNVPVRLLVFSDGYEHSRDTRFPRSFYENRVPRTIDPARELAIVEKAGLATRLPRPPAQVLWFGLGVRASAPAADPARPGQRHAYAAPSEISALRSFWEKLLAGWGIKNARVDHTLPNVALTGNSR